MPGTGTRSEEARAAHAPAQAGLTDGGTAGGAGSEEWDRLGRLAPLGLLAAMVVATAAGGILHAASLGLAGDRVWTAVGALGAAYSLWLTAAALRARRLGVDVIALLALVGAMWVGESLAAAVIAVMVATGRALEAWAAGRARHDLRALIAHAAREAHRYEEGALVTVPVDALLPGDRVMVGTGELVPADGNLLADAVLDESALTGESAPVERRPGDPVRSGVANAAMPFDLVVTAPAAESTYAGVVRLVAEAEASQAPFVRMADRYALWFLGVTLVAAGGTWAVAGLTRAVAVAVVATPCPLILAAPVALVAGLSRTARRGVVVKGGGVLERLARSTTLLVDKTGTLTSGRPALVDVATAEGTTAEEVLALAGSLDQVSPHVLAHAVVQAAQGRGCALTLPERVEEVPGRGVRGIVDGHEVAIGKAAWAGFTDGPAWVKSARRRAALDGSITVFVAVDGLPAGVVLLDDPVRKDAAATLRSLRRSGIRRIVMVTGDRVEVADSVGAAIGVDEVLAERSPADKVDAVRAEHSLAPTIMVGDGINDAPALALADVGVAMGARGATASSEAADVVLTVDRLDRLGEARSTAVRSHRIARQSVTAGMAMSLAAMGAASLGWLPALYGALLQEAIDVAVILNALRALRPAPGHVQLTGADSALTRRFRTEHVELAAAIAEIRATADDLGRVEAPRALARLRALHELLVEEVAPHEAAEEAVLYPALARVLGGIDPTGPMTREHVEIAHQIRRFGRMLDAIGPEGPDAAETADFQALLYGLYAVLRLHTAQEDESFLSLGDDVGAPEGG